MKTVMILCAVAAIVAPAMGQTPPVAGKSLEDSQVIAEPIPPEVVQSAVKAVEKLGEEVVLGRYQAAIDRMNPMWKSRVAERMGGMEALEGQLKDVAAAMVRQGITMISFKPQRQPRAYEVWPGTKEIAQNSKLVYMKWMVLVPTVTRFRIIPQGGLKAVIVESKSFQVAIRDKEGGDWTFIDGANLKPADLRSLFVTLPSDLELPPVEKKQVP